MNPALICLADFRIRFAERKDCALILWFIKELASFEGELDQVTASEAILERSLFDQRGAEVILGEIAGQPVCFALYFQSFSTFLGAPCMHLVDLYVVPEARGKGIGKAALSYLARLAVERDLGRLEWWVHDWNEPALAFYRSLGAVPLDNITVHRLCGGALRRFSEACPLGE